MGWQEAIFFSIWEESNTDHTKSPVKQPLRDVIQKHFFFYCVLPRIRYKPIGFLGTRLKKKCRKFCISHAWHAIDVWRAFLEVKSFFSLFIEVP